MKTLILIFAWFILIIGISFFQFGDSSVITNKVDFTQQVSNLYYIDLYQQEPTPSPFTEDNASDLVLPVAHNPGLVLGAVILVLIIIGGVILNSTVFKKK